MNLENKTILVTGGTGSFGQKFCEIVLREHNPKAIRVYSRDEFTQWQMDRKFQDERLRFFIGDVRDKERLSRAMNGVDYVFHAAALKHIPIAEYNPFEVIKTNITGTQNLIEAAIDNNVEKAILISTDKAVQPLNLYGASKLCAERLFVQANAYVGPRRTKFSCARYGNVLGSRGSVVPLFFEQKRKGKLTITDKKMTRFWITLEQGINFVLTSLDKTMGGEVFIPKIPSMTVTKLAEVIAPGVEIEEIGIRPGEKLHEVLVSNEEARYTDEFENHFVIKPTFAFWEKTGYLQGKTLAEDFVYSSDTNTWWLDEEEIRKILRDINNDYEEMAVR